MTWQRKRRKTDTQRGGWGEKEGARRVVLGCAIFNDRSFSGLGGHAVAFSPC